MSGIDTLQAAIVGLTPERRGDAFERAVAHFLRHDPTVGLARVWRWADWPGRIDLGLGRDLGVDLVAEDADGRLVAVQAKFHGDPRRHLGWEEVSTFLAYRPDLFTRRIVVTTAADRSANAKRATEARTDATWILLSDLAASPIDWTGALEAVSGAAVPERVVATPRPYQVQAVRDVVHALETAERVQLVMACGTGKTLVTHWVAEARDDRLVLVLVPTLLLLKQLRREWRTHAREPFTDLVVCSDLDTVGRDEWIVRADELGAPVTTDAAEIATFLSGPGRRVVFGTYASSARIAEAQTDQVIPAFDLVIADEAHRVAGIVATGAAVERDQRVVLDGARLRTTRRVFTTATPRVYGAATRGRFDGRADVEIASMDDPARFGAVAHQLWFRRAVDLGVLVDYRLIVVVVTDAEVAKLVEERAALVIDGRTYDAETLASLVAMRRAITDLGLTRSISFHHTIARSRDFAAALEVLVLGDDPPSAAHISGVMPVDDRERVLARLRDPDRPTVVTNARCLTEGIDVPSLDAVAFIDPRSSAVDIVQAVGRVMRRAPGKRKGHVIVPVFLNEADLDNPEAAIESTAFAPVLAVLRALRAHDPDLVSDATRIATSLGRRGAEAGGHISEHLVLLGRAFDLQRLRQALQLRLVDVAADSFESGLARLRRYADQYGTARPLAEYRDEDGFALVSWTSTRRSDRRRHALSLVRVAALEALPGWTWDGIEARWFEGYDRVARYARRHDTLPPWDYRDEDGYRPAIWVASRRSQAREALVSERVTMLEALPDWSWAPLDKKWQRFLAHIQVYMDEHGVADPPTTHVAADGYRLGRRVLKLRRQHSEGRMPRERVESLEAIPGWRWGGREDEWERWYERLRHFEELHGHTRVLSSFRTDDGAPLGQWVKGQRRQHAEGTLEAEHAARLVGLRTWSWESYEDQRWAIALDQLARFQSTYGHLRVPRDHRVQDVSLGTWLQSRRGDYDRNTLPVARRHALEALPGWSSDPHEDRWQLRFLEVARYANEHGTTLVPRSYRLADGTSLGMWVTTQRALRRVGKLSADRVAALGSLHGWTWDARPK